MVEKNDEVNAPLWMQIEPDMICSQSDDLRGKMIGKVIVARSQRLEYRSNETQQNLPNGGGEGGEDQRGEIHIFIAKLLPNSHCAGCTWVSLGRLTVYFSTNPYLARLTIV